MLTLDEVIEQLWNDPSSEMAVRLNYFDRDVVQSAERFAQSTEFHEILRLLSEHKPPAKLLDLGAGRGIASYAFAKAGYQVSALDPDPSPIVGLGVTRELAERTGVQIEIIESAGEDIPLPDGSYDIVYVRQVLHHARNLEQLCREVYRILKPGGVFLATREHVISKQEDLPIFLKNHMLHSKAGGENALLLKTYTDAIKGAGFYLSGVWGSHDSPINYYPRTFTDLKNDCSAVFRPYIPARILRPTLRIPFVFELCKKRRSQLNQTPGRLYSFLALKS